MDDATIQFQARALAASLSVLSPHDALSVLHQATGYLLPSLAIADLDHSERVPDVDMDVLLRPRRNRSKIERNPELQRYVNDRLSIPYMTLTEMCKAHFGADVAPSKSSVHRYIQKLRRAAEQQVEQRKEKHRARHKR